MFAGAQRIDSPIASAVGSVQGFMLLQSNGTLSSDLEPVRTAFHIRMVHAKLLKGVNQKRNARCFRNS